MKQKDQTALIDKITEMNNLSNAVLSIGKSLDFTNEKHIDAVIDALRYQLDNLLKAIQES